jgi:hypothetical protein
MIMARLALAAAILTLLTMASPAQPPLADHRAPKPLPAAAAPRQGGDTLDDAAPIPSLPFTDVGATCGYADNHDAACPYLGSTSPDVVYVFTPPMDMAVTVDLCGSGYDTKVYILDQDGAEVACNDDYYAGPPCGEYVSFIDHAELIGRLPYYIVVDGFGGDCGDYVLTVAEHEPCALPCPPGAYLEGEPVLGDGYVDEYNNGCGGGDGPEPIQHLPAHGNGTLIMCAWSGWFVSQGMDSWDTDWFSVTAGATGQIHLRADAEQSTHVCRLGPNDCATVGIVQSMTVGPCDEGEMTLTVAPGSTVWLWAAPAALMPPGGFDGAQYGYVMWLDGLAPTDVTGVPDEPLDQPASWSAVRGLFR